MAETSAYASIWHITPGDITFAPNKAAPHLMRLGLCAEVDIVLDSGAGDVAQQVAAMRKLAEVAAEAAAELERRAAEC